MAGRATWEGTSAASRGIPPSSTTGARRRRTVRGAVHDAEQRRCLVFFGAIQADLWRSDRCQDRPREGARAESIRCNIQATSAYVQDDSSAALEGYAAALRLDPSNVFSLANRIHLYQSLGDSQARDLDVQTLARVKPDHRQLSG
jgi:Tfp pilus assembly protein PilF